MSENVKPIPEGYEGVTPYLICKNAEAAIEFYKKAFGAVELFRIGEPGMVGHAEMKIGNAIIMLADEHPQMQFTGPATRGGTTVHLHVYLKDVDAQVAKALKAGARLVRPIKDQFYGDRLGTIEDPFGHVWHLATRVEDLSKAEMKKRAAKAAAGE